MITPELISKWSQKSVEAVINCEPGELKPQNVLLDKAQGSTAILNAKVVKLHGFENKTPQRKFEAQKGKRKCVI